MDKISIIVPIYKVEQYLHRCIDSLINQDDDNIEIILVDDGSPDDCPGICDEYQKKDQRIKVIHQINGGLSAARNSGIDIATGDYLMFVDSDDFVEPNYCSYALDQAIMMDSEIVVFGHNDIYSDRSEVQTILFSEERRYNREEALIELIGGKILSFAWNKIYKASLFDGIRYPEGRLYEDVGTTYKLFDKANAVFLASGVTYNYQKREDSILGKKMKAKDAIDWFDLEMERHDFLLKRYPQVADKSWKKVACTVLFCLKNLCNFKGYKDKQREMESFLIKNRKQIESSGLKDTELKLLYLSPNLFHFHRGMKHIIKVMFYHN